MIRPTSRDKNEQNRAVVTAGSVTHTITSRAMAYLAKGSRFTVQGRKYQVGQGRKMEESKDNLDAEKQREYPETSYVSLFINSNFSGFLFGRATSDRTALRLIFKGARVACIGKVRTLQDD